MLISWAQISARNQKLKWTFQLVRPLMPSFHLQWNFNWNSKKTFLQFHGEKWAQTFSLEIYIFFFSALLISCAQISAVNQKLKWTLRLVRPFMPSFYLRWNFNWNSKKTVFSILWCKMGSNIPSYISSLPLFISCTQISALNQSLKWTFRLVRPLMPSLYLRWNFNWNSKETSFQFWGQNGLKHSLLIFLSSSHPPPFLMTASSQNLSKFYDFEDPVNGKAFHGIQLFVKANTKQCLPILPLA